LCIIVAAAAEAAVEVLVISVLLLFVQLTQQIYIIKGQNNIILELYNKNLISIKLFTSIINDQRKYMCFNIYDVNNNHTIKTDQANFLKP